MGFKGKLNINKAFLLSIFSQIFSKFFCEIFTEIFTEIFSKIFCEIFTEIFSKIFSESLSENFSEFFSRIFLAEIWKSSFLAKIWKNHQFLLKFEKSSFFGHPCDNWLLPIQTYCHMLLCRLQDRICLLCRVICCCVIDTTIDTLMRSGEIFIFSTNYGWTHIVRK